VVTYGVPTSYLVYVSDDEDGNTEDGTIDCSQVTATPGLGHNDYVHDLIPIVGCNGTLTPTQEDTVGEFFTVLRVQYSDRGNLGTASLSSTLMVRLQPSLYQAENYDEMFGVEVSSTSDPAGGYQSVGRISDGDWTMYKDWNLQGIDNVTVRFANPQLFCSNVKIRINSLDGRDIGAGCIPSTGGFSIFSDFTFPVKDTNQFFEVDLGVEYRVKKLVMKCGKFQYPRGYDIYVSTNPDPSSRRYFPIDWVVSANGTSETIEANFPSNTRARFVKIVQTAESEDTWTIEVSNNTRRKALCKY